MNGPEPLTRAALVETEHCCIPLPVGEEKNRALQPSRIPLSHRERDAAARLISRRGAGESGGSFAIRPCRAARMASPTRARAVARLVCSFAPRGRAAALAH